MTTSAALACLELAAVRLAARARRLEERITHGDESAWPEYLATLDTLSRVLDHLAPGREGGLLTTREMAARLNLSPKSLLRQKAQGKVRPALQRGKLVRWRGDEGLRGA